MTRVLTGPRTFDPAPLLAHFHGAKDHEIASHLDVCRTTVQKWRTGNRRLSADMADQIAIRLGLHPLNLWSDWEVA